MRWEALPSLARLGPHSSAAVPKLSELLMAEFREDLAGGVAVSGRENVGGRVGACMT